METDIIRWTRPFGMNIFSRHRYLASGNCIESCIERNGRGRRSTFPLSSDYIHIRHLNDATAFGSSGAEHLGTNLVPRPSLGESILV